MAGSLGYAVAPIFSGGLGALFGWHNALFAGAGVGSQFFSCCSSSRLVFTW